jgi:Fe-S-cluster containining protein
MFVGTEVVTAPTSFDDDADSVSGCTGACCDPVSLFVEHYRDASRDPRHTRNARYVMNMLTPRGPLPREGRAEFDCRYFDRDTRRCTAYDRRPQMCRDFPEEGVCHLCGSRFDARPPPAESTEHAAGHGARSAVLRELMSQSTQRPRDARRRRKR